MILEQLYNLAFAFSHAHSRDNALTDNERQLDQLISRQGKRKREKTWTR